MLRCLVLLALTTAPALAAEPLGPDEFAARVTGRTLHFQRHGAPYGSEQYLPGRQVIWRFAGDICIAGFWYSERGKICFVYDREPGPQCWDFLRGDDGLRARAEGGSPEDDLSVAWESAEPLDCQGPSPGV
ncbi:hypothetical protein [Maritimibacter sp. 55A14]|uniref:hypothetical protein n=1 Tax=Maritimibacter sp. 55A14 TaxID=2174844 RepID=UPI001E44C10B|nr:hypothetical protein [Maritimibacter sp. 55A14]